jgi:predicted HAD superfamily Cof-like phosphohydrolase
MEEKRMNKHYKQVQEFHKACSIDMPSKPTMLSKGDQAQSIECVRFGQKLEHISNLMKESELSSPVLVRAAYMLEELSEFLYAETIEDQADALGDITYFNVGTHTLMGLPPEQVFDEIHGANMRKVVNGKVLRNELGKIQKPEGWYGPEGKIKEYIEKRIRLSGEIDTLFID